MYQHFDSTSERNMQPKQWGLTEDNLRTHTLQTSESPNCSSFESSPLGWCHQYAFGQDDSEDEDVDDLSREIAWRKAASLEALQVYGGCFVSGFLAMQEPLPRPARTSRLGIFRQHIRRTNLRDSVMDVATITSYNSGDSPRPDSDTLSFGNVRAPSAERRWSWRSFGRQRRIERKW